MDQPNERATSPTNTYLFLSYQISPPAIMALTSNENRLIFAFQALNRGPKISLRAAAKINDVPQTTLQCRHNNIPSRCNSTPNLQKLSDLEESTIIQYILDLDARSFPPHLCGVQDMAN